MKTLTQRARLLAGLVLVAALLPAWASGQDKAQENKQDSASPPKGQRVFFASHSLMWYVPTPLGELAEAAKIKDHKLVGLQSLGASKTLQHWNLPEERNKAKQALTKGDVDVFVMSPIQFPDEGIDNFVKLGLENNPNMRFLVQISWGGWDIDNQDFPKGATNTVDRNKTPEQLKKLYERNIKAAEAQAAEINKKAGKKVLFLVPSAQAVVTLRSRISNKEMPGLTKQAELFRDPISHPAPPLEALNTYLHYAMIYGQSPVGLPMPGLLKKAKNEAWDDKCNRALQEIAWETVANYPYSGVQAAAKEKGQQSADYDDYNNMLDQLGIKKMRKGRDAKVKDTSDEATANPYKDSMPDLMTFKDKTKVTTADQWPKRRAEIVEEFEREVSGRIPKKVPKVKWEVTKTVEGESGGIAIVTKTLVGHVDNSDFPKIKVDIQASFTVPKYAGGKVPIILQFGGGFGGGRGGPNSWTQQALDKAWGYGTINPNSIQGDNSKLREGIIGLTNKGEPRSPEDWGALRAWAWGVSRLIDYFEADKDSGVDPTKVCITGVSRYGKAALVTTAFDTRIAAGFVASSGTGGAKLFRRDFGELLENLASRGGYHWMAGNFLKYAAGEATFGKKTVADLPVDQHMLIALCAPRPCFISYGVPEKGDPNWVDAHGSFMATVLAGRAYRLLGKKDLGTPGDYLTDKMPEVNKLIGGELAWRQHDGGHTNVPNFPAFYEWAGRYISTPGLTKKK